MITLVLTQVLLERDHIDKWMEGPGVTTLALTLKHAWTMEGFRIWGSTCLITLLPPCV